jgi:hypothetical protein
LTSPKIKIEDLDDLEIRYNLEDYRKRAHIHINTLGSGESEGENSERAGYIDYIKL